MQIRGGTQSQGSNSGKRKKKISTFHLKPAYPKIGYVEKEEEDVS